MMSALELIAGERIQREVAARYPDNAPPGWKRRLPTLQGSKREGGKENRKGTRLLPPIPTDATAGNDGIQAASSDSKSSGGKEFWCARRDSNSRPTDSKSAALSN